MPFRLGCVVEYPTIGSECLIMPDTYPRPARRTMSYLPRAR
jgi:hypothetical protein